MEKHRKHGNHSGQRARRGIEGREKARRRVKAQQREPGEEIERQNQFQDRLGWRSARREKKVRV